MRPYIIETLDSDYNYYVAARVRKELQGSADAAINFRLVLLASILLITIIHGRLFVSFCEFFCEFLCDFGFCLHAAKLIMFIMIIIIKSSCSFDTSTEASAPAVLSLYPRRVWATAGIVVSWFVCLFVIIM